MSATSCKFWLEIIAFTIWLAGQFPSVHGIYFYTYFIVRLCRETCTLIDFRYSVNFLLMQLQIFFVVRYLKIQIIQRFANTAFSCQLVTQEGEVAGNSKLWQLARKMEVEPSLSVKNQDKSSCSAIYLFPLGALLLENFMSCSTYFVENCN